jgi:AraC family transcriptional regulator of adaptative response / DNA-3-methyladenine glycosylase II
MHLDRRACDRARRSRDARFDGRFFIAVTSTRIYCRPICPARAPKDGNIRYYPTAAAAEAAGFRPCLRCRPEASPGTPAWLGTSGLVSRGLRLIGEGALDREGVEALSDRLGVTARHLRRLFLQHVGASPLEVALTRRGHFAKKLLDETTLSFSQVALAAGFGSVRRFNAHMQRTYSRTPTELRRKRAASEGGTECYRLSLAYRPPLDWQALTGFLAARATPGVEVVEALCYRRTIGIGDQVGTLAVSLSPLKPAIELEVRFPDSRVLLLIVERVRRMFDLGADPSVIAQHLGGDPLLGPVLARHPGIRTPGAWDGFELSVRAILGQQVSVAAATTIAGRLAARFGRVVHAENGLDRIFPTPSQLAAAPIEEVGVIASRAETIRCLARAVMAGRVTFGTASAPEVMTHALEALPGIGPWTAQYIAMRALGEPDAFLSGDLILRQMAGDCTARALEQHAERWRPWRAYAVMLLWQAAKERNETLRRKRHANAAPSHSRTARATGRAPALDAR